MAQIAFEANRAYPSIPTIGGDSESHVRALRIIKEAIEIHERRTKNYLDSFVRVGELVTLGLIDVDGNVVLDDDGVIGGGGGGVTSFATRTGAVVPTAGDYDAFYYTESEIDTALAALFTDDQTVSGAWEFTHEDALYLTQDGYGFHIYTAGSGSIYEGGLVIAADDPWDTDFGFYIDAGGFIFLQSGGDVQAGASPELGDEFFNAITFATEDGSNALGEIGWFGDTILQMGNTIIDGDITYYCKTEPSAVWEYPFYVSAANRVVWIQDDFVFRVGDSGGDYDDRPTNYVQFDHDDVDFNITGTNTTDINVTGVDAIRLDGYFFADRVIVGTADNQVTWYGVSGANFVVASHDDTDFNLDAAGGTVDLNIDGFTTMRLETGRAVFERTPGADNATPTVAFGDGDTGFYETSDDTLQISVGGTQRFFVSTTQFAAAVSSAGACIQNEAASATNPTLIPRRTSTDTGIGSPANDQLSLVANGVESMRVEESQITMRSYVFDIDQTVGAGQDDYVLTYDNSSGLISLEAPAAGGGGSGLNSGTLVLSGGTALNTYNNQPSTGNFWQSNSRWRYKFDLSDATSIRLIFNVAVASASANTPQVRLKYATSLPANYAATSAIVDGGSELAGSLAATGFVDTGWQTIIAAAAADNVYLALTGIGGDGVADPSISNVLVMFK